MKSHLENYLRNLESKGLLKKEKIGIDQVKALLTSASKNVSASEKNLSIDEEASYTLAYNAMLKIARALIFLKDYRPSDGQHGKPKNSRIRCSRIKGLLYGQHFETICS